MFTVVKPQDFSGHFSTGFFSTGFLQWPSASAPGLQLFGADLGLRHGCGVVADLDSAAPAAVSAPRAAPWQVPGIPRNLGSPILHHYLAMNIYELLRYYKFHPRLTTSYQPKNTKKHGVAPWEMHLDSTQFFWDGARARLASPERVLTEHPPWVKLLRSLGLMALVLAVTR